MQLSILDALNKAKQQSKQISDFTLKDELFRMGIDNDIIEDVLLEPVTERQNFIDYFRNKK